MSTPQKVVVKAVNYATPTNTTFFSVSDGSTSQNVFTGNTVSLLAGNGIDTVLSAGNTVTISPTDELASLAGLTTTGILRRNSNSTVSAGSVTTITEGGTGSTTAEGARNALGLGTANTPLFAGVQVFGQAQFLTGQIGLNSTQLYGSVNSGVEVTLPTVSGTLLTTDGSGASLTNLNASAITTGTIDPERLPRIVFSEYLGLVASEAEMLALNGDRGDWCKRSDTGQVFMLSGDNSTLLYNWVEISDTTPNASAVNTTGFGSLYLDGTNVQTVLESADTALDDVYDQLALKAPILNPTLKGTVSVTSVDSQVNEIFVNGTTGKITALNLESEGLKTGGVNFYDLGGTIPAPIGYVDASGIRLDPQFSANPQESKISWNATDGTFNAGLKGGNISLPIGQTEVVRIVNKTNSNLTKADYKIIRVRTASEGGPQGRRLAGVLAQANGELGSVTTLGVVAENIDNNQEGFVQTFGVLRGINASGKNGESWQAGDVLYLSPTTPGELTKVKPSAPNHTVVMGYVLDPSVNHGSIFIKVDNGYELDELHNVSISSPSSGNYLRYNGTLWQNYTLTKSDVGLSNVDNTTDANKPISTATQTALNNKVTNAGNISAIQKLTQAQYTALGGTVSATTMYVIVG